MKKLKKPAALDLLKICCRALDEKKAGDLRVFDVSEQSSITDFLVLATATSDPHLRAMRIELEKAVDASKTRIVGIDAAHDSGWMVVDLFDVMVHLFLPDRRSLYALEMLWKDATELSLEDALAGRSKEKPIKKAPKAVKTVRKKRKST
jgi:ribosome-associated protein